MTNCSLLVGLSKAASVVGGKLDVCASWQSCHCEALSVGADMTFCLLPLFLILPLSGWHRTLQRVKRKDPALLMETQRKKVIVTVLLWLPLITSRPILIQLAYLRPQLSFSRARGLQTRTARSTSASYRPQDCQSATVLYHSPTGRLTLSPPVPHPSPSPARQNTYPL